MGGSSKTTQQSSGTSTSSIDPSVEALQIQNYWNSQDAAKQLGQAYTGNLSAGYGGTPLGAAQGGFSDLANYQAPILAASTYNPAASLTAGQLSSTNLSPYLNPYTNDVVNSTISQAMRAKGISDANDAAQATAAGAFGGSRSAVLQNLDDNSWQQNLQSTLAGLNNTGYQNAQQAALADIGNKLTADQANQAALNSAGQFNANQTQSAGLANQNASLQGAGIQGNANSSLANIAQLLYGADTANIDRAYNAWLAQKQGLLSGQQVGDAALAGIQAPQTTTGSSSSTSKTSQSPGIGQILGGLGSLAMGIGTGGLGFAPFAAGAGASGASAAGSNMGIFNWGGQGAGVSGAMGGIGG